MMKNRWLPLVLVVFAMAFLPDVWRDLAVVSLLFWAMAPNWIPRSKR